MSRRVTGRLAERFKAEPAVDAAVQGSLEPGDLRADGFGRLAQRPGARLGEFVENHRGPPVDGVCAS